MKYDSLFVREEFPERLSKQELLVLLNRMKQGDMEAREEFINNNIGLVINIVINSFMNLDCDRKKELISIGCIGLIKAADSYDISKKVEFSSYARRCIDNEITTFFRRLKGHQNDVSIENVVYSDENHDDVKLEDLLPNEVDIEGEYIEEEYSKTEVQLLRQSIECLDERDKKIIILYFGLYGNKKCGQQEIANIMHITQPNICKIINRTLKKIKSKLEELSSDDLDIVSNNTLKRKNNI